MKRIVLFMFSLFLVVGIPFVGAVAEVNININVPPPPPPPPPLEFPGPPDVAVVPSGPNDVYLVPDMAGLYFYGGYWYRFHEGYWFRASLYSGPWVTIRQSLVPRAVVVIPPDYIVSMPPGYHRIHYGDFPIGTGGIGVVIATGTVIAGTEIIPSGIGVVESGGLMRRGLEVNQAR